MSDCVLICAPHADDETLGAGGALLRHVARGDAVHWVLGTEIPAGGRVGASTADAREGEIARLGEAIGFASTRRLGFATTTLDAVPLADQVGAISQAIAEIRPTILYLPFPGDAHSDHAAMFRAGVAGGKWFRNPSVRSVRVYETLSETNFGLSPIEAPFRPNLFIDISEHLERKLALLAIFEREMGAHPFPRSEASVRALATLRGSEAGCAAAEAFMVLREIER